jgi:hypothetical protein
LRFLVADQMTSRFQLLLLLLLLLPAWAAGFTPPHPSCCVRAASGRRHASGENESFSSGAQLGLHFAEKVVSVSQRLEERYETSKDKLVEAIERFKGRDEGR